MPSAGEADRLRGLYDAEDIVGLRKADEEGDGDKFGPRAPVECRRGCKLGKSASSISG